MRGQSVLPPLQLQFLAPPISFGHARAHIDLNVDFKTEVEPFLGRCLVRSGRASNHWVRLCVEVYLTHLPSFVRRPSGIFVQ